MIDVCFILEGTYPYVSGGVSTWVHQLISAVKDLRFAIVYIGAHSDPTRMVKYEVPSHVVYMKEIYLHDYDLTLERQRNSKKKDYELLRGVYEDISRRKYESFSEIADLFQGENKCFDIKSFFSSKEVWNGLIDFYDRYGSNISFLDFFWTWRSTHLPLMHLLQSEIPKAKIYHSVSTGYAGLLAAVAKVKHQQKFFLTEHGIYTHERMLEIAQSTWIYEQENRRYRAERDLSFFKKWWIEIFRAMSGVAYHYADNIYTLFEGNKVRQTLEGADPRKISIVPNGINVRDFEKLDYQKRKTPQVGFIGRVVSIKDVKTFIRSAKLVLQKIPDAEFYIIGPTDEESDYFEECQMLVEALGLDAKITFTGRVNAQDYYSFLDLIVLTSLSEAQPYVILEANIAGIPVVATNVGACREMLEGRTADDRDLGPSGVITQVANPEDTAQSIVKVLTEKKLYQQMSKVGKERVKKYYDQDDLLSRYLNIYEQNS